MQPKVDEWANQVRMQMVAKGGVALAQVSQPSQEKIPEAEVESTNQTFNGIEAIKGLEAIEKIVKTVNYQNVTNWKNQVMQTTQYGEPFLRFTLCGIISLGAILKLVYQSYGMAGLPIFLIKGTKSLEAENDEILGSISTVRE